MTDIPAGKLGVKTRLYGNDLPPGRIMATEGTKGIVADVLAPWQIPYQSICLSRGTLRCHQHPPGHAGVVTALTGEDILHNDLPPESRNGFLATKP
jgi:hypothetical protein